MLHNCSICKWYSYQRGDCTYSDCYTEDKGCHFSPINIERNTMPIRTDVDYLTDTPTCKTCLYFNKIVEDKGFCLCPRIKHAKAIDNTCSCEHHTATWPKLENKNVKHI